MTDVYFEVWSNYCVSVIWSADPESERQRLAEEAGTKYDASIPARGSHLFHPSKGHSWMVFSHEADEGTIAHECWHAIRAMLEWNGAELDNETVAYHLGFLVLKTHQSRLSGESRQ